MRWDYINRENIETKFSGDQLMDAAKEMLKPYNKCRYGKSGELRKV